MDTEILATTAVKERVAQTKYLSPFINEGDKEPSWDGNIYAYNKPNKTKDSLFGRAPVQIKGLMKKTLSKKTINYRLSMTDLKNFRNDGGTILFVVYINSDFNKCIYYVALTPFYLNQVIRTQSNEKKPKLSLRVLPEGKEELTNIVFNFIRDGKKQSLLRNGKNFTEEEAINIIGIENIGFNFTYTGLGYDKNDPFSYLKNNDIYLYAENKDKSISIPIQHIHNVIEMVEEGEALIEVKGKSYVEKTKYLRNINGKIEFTIGRSFTFILSEGNERFKYHLEGNLNERIQDIQTMLDIYEESGITVNGVKFNIFPTEAERKLFDVREHKLQLKYYKTIKQTFDKLNVKKPLEISDLDDRQDKNLVMLINAILYNRTSTFKEHVDIAPVVTLNFANIRILLYFRKNNDNSYTIEDFFACKISCSLEEQDKYPTTKYCILKCDDYLNDDNMMLDKVEQEFMEFDNEGHLQRMVLCILEVIKAYDKDNERIDLLEMAIRLCCWLRENQPDDKIHILNYLQCCIRKRDLTDDELMQLNSITNETDVVDSILAGTHILLGNKRIAKIYIDKLPENEKTEFMNYPIYHLYEEL